MSTCISSHGEYGDHVPDAEYRCTRCHVLDEDALVNELVRLRQELRDDAVEMVAAKMSMDEATMALRDYRVELAEARAFAATCSCGTSPETYDGPQADCPVHGAVRALAEVQAKLEAVRKLHEPMLSTVEWWHDQTGDGHGYICPTCHPDPNGVGPHVIPMGEAGVKPEGFVESYILSPCPTLAACHRESSAS